ncbi:helix-turn-helix domain-containing protein [Saccharicrinis sp. GN24d3]|uniref:helix-turn-helix domain-containing protein n=1 Tax=Saccharicrinis sp. GN24d3 TaxID=3458416 RepID=UPI004037272C
MNPSELLKNISFNLSSVGSCKVGTEWNYRNIISSFSRLYLVTDGEASIYIGEERIHLKKGHLYLIPSFTHCSYVCENELSHYYATFTIQLRNNLSIYQLFNFNYEIEASVEHSDYFKRLYETNPNMELPAKDPRIYQRLSSKSWNHPIYDADRSLTSSGLLYLLLSKFVGYPKIDLEKGDASDILLSLKYIHSNLETELTVTRLTELSCLSTGHYTRKFKQLMQLTPLDYINKQRIEKAQLLLNTTSQSCIEIAEACGYKSNAYFCKVFKKHIGKSPGEYRINQVL